MKRNVHRTVDKLLCSWDSPGTQYGTQVSDNTESYSKRPQYGALPRAPQISHKLINLWDLSSSSSHKTDEDNGGC